jgi:hypothetical protein
MSSTITQIVGFTMKEEINFKEFASAMKSGTKGLRSQMLGVGIEESEARRWILRNSFFLFYLGSYGSLMLM